MLALFYRRCVSHPLGFLFLTFPQGTHFVLQNAGFHLNKMSVVPRFIRHFFKPHMGKTFKNFKNPTGLEPRTT